MDKSNEFYFDIIPLTSLGWEAKCSNDKNFYKNDN